MLREPLLHFCLIGSSLFALYHFVHPRRDRIVLSPSFVEGLRKEAQTRTGRPPTPKEEAALIQHFVDEEILYREAISLGLDRGDVIVRRRLVQKMEMLTNPAAEPTQEELEAYLRAHASRYEAPPRVSFHHVFNGGQPFIAGRSWSQKSEQEIAALFGDELARAVMSLTPGQWSPPLRSRFGTHQVFVDEKFPAEPGRVSPRVREDWLRDRRKQLDETALAQLRTRYTVEK
jgi:hypothetical protein